MRSGTKFFHPVNPVSDLARERRSRETDQRRLHLPLVGTRDIARQFFEAEKSSARFSIAPGFDTDQANLDARLIKRDTANTTRYESMKAVRYNSKNKSWKETPISSAKSAKLRAQQSEKFLKDGTPKLIGRLSAQLKRKSLQPV